MLADYLNGLFFKFLSFEAASLLLLSGLLLHPLPSLGGTETSLAPSKNSPEHTVLISIKTRNFRPDHIRIPLGEKTRLILKNLDSELHAFLPVGLLTNTHINLQGNGAPQFGKSGLVRVLLPSRGHTEIVFVPSKPGTYPFFCDLPGHVMRGNIVVQEKQAIIH